MKSARCIYFISLLRGIVVGILVTNLMSYGLSPFRVFAEITQCRANPTSPTYIAPSSSSTVTFNIEDNGPDNATWIRLTRPSSHFTFTAGSLSGWSAAVTSSTITFTGGTLRAGQEANLSVTMTAGSTEVSAQTFTLELSDTEDESGAFTCSSDASIQITSTPPTTFGITDVAVSNVASTSVTVSFSTGTNATSMLEYGTNSDSYDYQDAITTATDSHSYNITGLSANTTYHYRLSADDDGDTDETTDATFTTALSASATSTPGPTATPKVTTNTVTLPTPTPTPDKTSPVVTVDKLTDKTYSSSPTFTGSAVDNEGIASLEYSLDKKSWTRISSVTGLKTASVTFSFSPSGLSNGNNSVIVRARDNAGNIGTSNSVLLNLDQTGPTIFLHTDLSAPVGKSPEITGDADDYSGESEIEYSIDGEKNWIPVDKVSLASDTKTRFEFVPSLPDDGNYSLKIRAKDPLGNQSAVLDQTIIIDRLPPRIGGFILSIGPQLLRCVEYCTTSKNVRTLLSVSVIGGPTSVTATVSNDQKISVPLTRRRTGSLWSGDLIFTESGDYILEITAIDGAGHTTTKALTRVHVLPSGSITHTDGTPAPSTITIYTKDSLTGSYFPWDGIAYSQQNPQRFTQDTSFAFYPPSGEYYLEITRPGYAPVVTNTFFITAGEPVSPQIILPPPPSFTFLGITIQLPSLLRQHITVDIHAQEQQVDSVDLSIALPPEMISIIDPTDSRGEKQATLVVLNTWHPQIASFLQQLEEMQQNESNSIVLALFPHESAATIELFAKRGGYTIPLRADPDGELLELLPYPSLPTLYTMTEDLIVVTQKQQ